MNKGMIRYIVAALFVAGMAILTGAGIAGYSNGIASNACNSLCVEFNGGEPFLDADAVNELLEEEYGVFVGQRIDSISLHRVEEILDASGPVKKSEAWITGDGVLHVSLEQRDPVLRFYDGRDGFYTDSEGVIFPLLPRHQAAVPVVYGKRPSAEEWPLSVVHTVTYLRDKGVAADSLECNSRGELTLIGGKGENILLGRPGRIEEQYPLLECYYERIVPSSHEYRSINLKYRKQIICRD